ncbi:MAG: hypothetical protein RL701_3352 [Pseudomonadota bacterium]|jgi:hypothetical protein
MGSGWTHPVVVIFALSGVLLVWLLVPIFYEPYRDNQIIKNGRSASARILKVERTGVSVNDEPQVWLDLMVMPEDDTPAFQGRTKGVISLLSIPRFQPGGIIKVSYMPSTREIALVSH